MSIPKAIFAAIVISTLAACSSSPDAPSATSVTGLPPLNVDKTDTNADGNIDREEFNQRLHYLFITRDSDGNDSLSLSEIPEVKPNVYLQADQDNSGELSKKEYFYMRNLDFDDLDIDNNNLLYSRELIRWR